MAEINDEVRGTYSSNKQIKFKTSILGSSSSDYGDAYILVKENITVITGQMASEIIMVILLKE